MGLRPSVKHEGERADLRNENNSANHFNHGSSASSTTSAASPTQREAWTARGQLLLNFHHIISRAINGPEMIRKCSQIAEDMKRGEGSVVNQPILPTSNSTTALPPVGKSAAVVASAGQHTMAEEYGAEAALIVENKANRDALVMTKSLTAGLLSFVALRSGRGLSSFVRKSISNSRVGGAYQFEKIVASKYSSANSSDQPRSSKLRQFFSLTFDVTISSSIALLSGSFLFMPRPSAYIEDMSKLPLVEGKSVYAEMVCPPLLKEYRRVLMQYGGRWPVNSGAGGSDSQLTQEDVSLNVIRTFVQNCYKRSLYEHALLEERNTLSYENETDSTVARLMKRIERRIRGSDAINDTTLGTVSVPSPGVPAEIAVDLDSEILSLPPDGGERK